MFKKEKESFGELKQLDELLVDDIEDGPELVWTPPDIRRSVHNQSQANAIVPSEKAIFVNLISVIIDLRIVSWYSVKLIFSKLFAFSINLLSKRNECKFHTREWEVL